MTELLAFHMAACETCFSVRVFTTERERDLWQRHHTHDQSQSGYSE
jgi:hypothetical protein